jgi:hypothetical protein
MASDKPKLPGVKGHHFDNPRDDGSVSFKLVGGKWNGTTARLYPQNGGHETVIVDGGGVYEWNGSRTKPAMQWKEDEQ